MSSHRNQFASQHTLLSVWKSSAVGIWTRVLLHVLPDVTNHSAISFAKADFQIIRNASCPFPCDIWTYCYSILYTSKLCLYYLVLLFVVNVFKYRVRHKKTTPKKNSISRKPCNLNSWNLHHIILRNTTVFSENFFHIIYMKQKLQLYELKKDNFATGRSLFPW